MKITKLIKITAGKRHAWYETDMGFNVRKPIKNFLPYVEPITVDRPIIVRKKLSFWGWIKKVALILIKKFGRI